QTAAAATIFLLWVLVWPGGPRFPGYEALALLVPLALAALYPPVIQRLLNRLLGLLGRPAIRLELGYRQVLALYGLHLLARLVVGLGFFLFARALHPFPWSALPALIATFAGAWVVGFAVFFVPLGLGVREGVMTSLLTLFCPLPVATAIALGFRVWVALRDLALALAAGALLRVMPGQQRPLTGEG
ncbi:MAG: hypothetical protein GX605_09465, partial [Chloroflexi bacterium]|nr:hypothetical protein [Chloroflexota bacterium]